MIQKGTIVVKTGKNSNIGEMFKTFKDDEHDLAYITQYSAIVKCNYRLATAKEIEAYNNGIRHIDDIDKSTQSIPDFLIYTSHIGFNKYIEFCESYNIPFNRNWSGNSSHYGVFNNNPSSSYQENTPKFKNLESLKEFLKLKPKTEKKWSDFVIDTGYINFENYRQFCLKYNIPFWSNWKGACKHYGVYNNEPVVSPIPQDLPIFKNLTKLKEFLNLNTKTNEKITTITTESRRSRKGSVISSSRTRQIAIGVRYIGNQTSSKFKTKRIESSKISSNIISC